MYNSNSIKLFYANGTRGALSNICHGNGIVKAYASVMDLRDAVEDSNNSEELLKNLKKLRLVGMGNLVIDRDNSNYTRVKGADALGNVHYLIAEKN